MKRIGICACYDTLNYGSMLQSFATQYTIDKLGYKSEYIVYRKKKDALFYLKALPRLLNSSMFHDKYRVFKKRIVLSLNPTLKRGDETRRKAFKRFEKKYYKSFSTPFNGYEELEKGANSYDTVVVGSDQLWLPGGLGTNFYNLMFVPDSINKVSYATSFGVSTIPWYQKKRTEHYLKRINHLSVREKQGAKIIKDLTGRDALVVADPTMLLTREEWDKAIPSEQIIHEPYIFCYFLGTNEKHRDVAEQLAKESGLKIVSMPFLDNYFKRDVSFGDKQLFDIAPNDFVNIIRNAKYVLTDSFHGTVFSILYHKQFIIFNRFNSSTSNSRNSRIDSLCDTLGLQDRRYSNKYKINELASRHTDYSLVDDKLQKIRKMSIDFLQESLL